MSSIPVEVIEAESKRLKAIFLRLKRTSGMTQQQLAGKCGWRSAATINNLLAGKVALTRDSLTLISKALDIEPTLISNRFANRTDPAGRIALDQLPVIEVIGSSKGMWYSSDLPTLLLRHTTYDPKSYGLVFSESKDNPPLGFRVFVIEPSLNPVQGDLVIIKKGVGTYTLGEVCAPVNGERLSVKLESGLTQKLSRSLCSVVASLVSRSLLIQPRNEISDDSHNRMPQGLHLRLE